MVLDAPVVVQQQLPWLGYAWFDDGYMSCIIQGGFWKNFYDYLHEEVDSAPELDSRLALLPQVAGTSSTTAVACSILVLMVLTHLALFSNDWRQCAEKRTVDDSVAPEFYLESVHYFYEPPVFQNVQCSKFCASGFFWSPRALTPVSARGLGEYRSRRESRVPGDSVSVLHIMFSGVVDIHSLSECRTTTTTKHTTKHTLHTLHTLHTYHTHT